MDTDSDGSPDECDIVCLETGLTEDLDDDGDGVSDSADLYPLIALGGLIDTDGDGAPDECDAACQVSGMSEDVDDDNDGVLDVIDQFPTDPSEFSDFDGDGLGDIADICDDTPASEVMVINLSGCGPSERDSDSDGFDDAEELREGSDPFDDEDYPGADGGFPLWILLKAIETRFLSW